MSAYKRTYEFGSTYEHTYECIYKLGAQMSAHAYLGGHTSAHMSAHTSFGPNMSAHMGAFGPRAHTSALNSIFFSGFLFI